MRHILSEDCPDCGATCYADNGDPDDLTVGDIEGLECPRCGRRWLLEGAEDWTDLAHANIVLADLEP